MIRKRSRGVLQAEGMACAVELRVENNGKTEQLTCSQTWMDLKA